MFKFLKTGLFTALLLAISANAFAISDGYEFVLNHKGLGQLGHELKKHGVVAIWDSTSGTNGTSAGHGLAVHLPAGAIITRSWIKVLTALTYSGTGGAADTLAFHCEDANNLFTATDIRGRSSGSLVEGVATGDTAHMVQNIAADCEITATVGGNAVTAGKAMVFVQYVIAE